MSIRAGCLYTECAGTSSAGVLENLVLELEEPGFSTPRSQAKDISEEALRCSLRWGLELIEVDTAEPGNIWSYYLPRFPKSSPCVSLEPPLIATPDLGLGP